MRSLAAVATLTAAIAWVGAGPVGAAAPVTASDAGPPASPARPEEPSPAKSGGKEPPAKLPRPPVAEPDAKTMWLWSGKCAGCHGEDGTAQTAAGRKHRLSDMTTAAWQASHSDEELRQVTLKGAGEMPPFEGLLTPEQLNAIVAHVRWLGRRR